MNSINSAVGCNNNTRGQIKISTSRLNSPSSFEGDEVTLRLPGMDKREPLGNHARDLMTDSDSDQQQQQQQPQPPSLSSKSSSSSSFDYTHNKVNQTSSQQVQHVKKSLKAPPLTVLRGRRGSQGIEAAKQTFALEKAAKLQEAIVAFEAPKRKHQTSEMSLTMSAPLHNPSGALNSSSSTSSTYRTTAQSRATSRSPYLLPSQPAYAKNTTTLIHNVSNQSSSHGRLNADLQHPLPHIPNGSPSPMTGRNDRIQNDWASAEHIFIKVYNLPDNTTTRDLWLAFNHESHISHIRLWENAIGIRDGRASIKFRPPPAKAFWENRRYPIQLAGGRKIFVGLSLDYQRPILPVGSKSKYPETMTMYAESVDFGMMFDKTTMMIMRRALPQGETKIKFCMNMFHKEILVEFPMHIIDPRVKHANMQRGKYDRTELFQFRIPFTQLKVIHQIANQGHKLVLLISMETPPKYFKQLDPSKSHDDEAVTWGDNDAWYRQTDLVYVPNGLKKFPLTWKKTGPIIDLGRWTTYRLTFNYPTTALPYFEQMRAALRDYNIEIVPFPKFQTVPKREATIWKILDPSPKTRSNTEMLHVNEPRMAFEVRYQLEVCLSQGFLDEHDLNEEFIKKLMDTNVKQAQDLLEYVANHGNRVHDPMSLLQAMNGQGSLSRTKIPSYCAYVRSATVTPTTVYFQTPVAETSNRVIRQYSQYADRFLRVRFTEEKTEGKIYPTHTDTMNEVFTRIKRVLTNGIKIGDRTYEFLACGNSQFREHGAYFFAPLPSLTTEKIRQWMGMFREIKTVALYASRLGQCFSTTRAIHGARANVIEIPDIKRNGYNFTDGVGKISPFLAHLAASELGILQHSQDPPSVFQIRVGGCKGVLAVSPDSVKRDIHIRKSQYKFPAMHEGLEIIRWSQYACANLNRQLVLILSALGVPDQVFAQKLQTQLSQLEQAMTDETLALAILQKEIDHNQMTLTVASMILDGFQKSGEPFLTSLLQLWRAWSIKYLKEKARITIGAGALLLGCVDETTILRGHFNDTLRPSADASNEEKAKYVPQVFVQISRTSNGKPEVMLGPMLLARNPSLHPGDVRVVCGVDVPQLHHLKDVVVLPQTGDRDVAGMCSGGDLDGDDFLVIWDQDLLPNEWNHDPMDYSRPPMEQPNENIGIDDLTTFFVTYMKNDSLPAIAQAHTANADYLEEGVKEAKCLKLASLHSMAVDYVKTGQPAYLSRDLKPLKWPHFMEKVGKQQSQIYTSKKVLGQLYDQVERIDFVPAFTAPFDTRILQAYMLDENILQSAREIKEEYDAHMRRIMAQQEIKTEFEVWSTFVLQHSSTSNAFKYHEKIGEISIALKDQFRLICYERAGGKDHEHIGPFAAAMYKITAKEITVAVKECHRVQMIGGQPRPLREMTPSAMPLMSFPWLFQDVLGKIAKYNTSQTVATLSTGGEIGAKVPVQPNVIETPQPKQGRTSRGVLDSEDYLKTSGGTTRPGELLELFRTSSEFYEHKEPTEAKHTPSTSDSVKSSNSSMDTSVERGYSSNDGLITHSLSSSPKPLARNLDGDCSHNVEVSVQSNPNSATDSVSNVCGSKGPLSSPGKTEVAGLVEEDETTALNAASLELFFRHDQILNVKPDYTMPEGSNLRLLNDPMMGLAARPEGSEDPVSKSSNNKGKNALEEASLAEEKAAKTSQLSKTNFVRDVPRDAEKDIVTKEEDNHHDADEDLGYSSDSDAEPDEVVIVNYKATLHDQLAKIAEDGCKPEARDCE